MPIYNNSLFYSYYVIIIPIFNLSLMMLTCKEAKRLKLIYSRNFPYQSSLLYPSCVPPIPMDSILFENNTLVFLVNRNLFRSGRNG